MPLLPDTALILSALHTIGAVLGAGGVTFAELLYAQGIADGKIDASEEKHIRATFFSLRWGMSLLLISGVGLIVVEYLLPNTPQHVMLTPFWVMNTLTVVILLFGFLLSRRTISLWLGGSVALTSWWMILILDAWQGPSPSYTVLMFTFVLACGFVAFVLACIRGLLKAHAEHK
jgi:small-conductance mechanosensitive channel